MPKYLITYHGGERPSSKEEGEKHMSNFKQWIMNHGESIVEPANPLSQTKTMSESGVIDGADFPMSGYSVIQTDDFDSAIALAKSCPHLNMKSAKLQVSEIGQMT